ncbi:MAG: uridine kinase [Chloroflexi bacterium]|nr:uridine kinase [Chloroflexota bacterium]
MKPIVFGVAGGSGSGKTTVAESVLAQVGTGIAHLPHDAYYRDFTELTLAERRQVNFDHPDSLETGLLIAHVRELVAGRPIPLPVYDFAKYRRTEQTIQINPSPIILVEGILIFDNAELRELMDVKIYVDVEPDIRFIRRMERDVQERGRALDTIIEQYLTTVRPMHLQFVEPSKRYADVIIPQGGRNQIAIGMVVSRLRELLSS